MKASDKVHLSRVQRVDIERQVRYVDFVSRQGFPITPGSDDVLAVFDATMLLLNADYTQGQLHAMLSDTDDNSSQALFVRRYHNLLSHLLADDIDVNFDESRVLEYYQQLFAEGTGTTLSRTRTAIASLRRGVVARESYTASRELSELVEWLLVSSNSATSFSLVDVAVFLYRFVRETTLPQGREEVMQLLMLLMLRRLGYNWVRLSAPAIVMVEDRVGYRRALLSDSDAQHGLTNWVVYFVHAVYEAAKRFSAKHAPVLPPKSVSHKTVLNSRQRAILDYIAVNQPVGVAAIVKHLHKESINTIKKDLLHLRKLGYIAPDGVLKGTVYYKI
ncbi:MAG: hypothetical protein J6L03_06495 [Bacteroidaceae bacterium]|nr:hypothetical protein [Bacteroidaceae bacterium]